ncbi:unnamed protein product [Scytosiphon promiscuus]
MAKAVAGIERLLSAAVAILGPPVQTDLTATAEEVPAPAKEEEKVAETFGDRDDDHDDDHDDHAADDDKDGWRFQRLTASSGSEVVTLGFLIEDGYPIDYSISVKGPNGASGKVRRSPRAMATGTGTAAETSPAGSRSPSLRPEEVKTRTAPVEDKKKLRARAGIRLDDGSSKSSKAADIKEFTIVNGRGRPYTAMCTHDIAVRLREAESSCAGVVSGNRNDIIDTIEDRSGNADRQRAEDAMMEAAVAAQKEAASKPWYPIRDSAGMTIFKVHTNTMKGAVEVQLREWHRT